MQQYSTNNPATSEVLAKRNIAPPRYNIAHTVIVPLAISAVAVLTYLIRSRLSGAHNTHHVAIINPYPTFESIIVNPGGPQLSSLFPDISVDGKLNLLATNNISQADIYRIILQAKQDPSLAHELHTLLKSAHVDGKASLQSLLPLPQDTFDCPQLQQIQDMKIDITPFSDITLEKVITMPGKSLFELRAQILANYGQVILTNTDAFSHIQLHGIHGAKLDDLTLREATILLLIELNTYLLLGATVIHHSTME